MENKVYKKGTFWERFLAFLIDLLLLCLIAAIPAYFFAQSVNDAISVIYGLIASVLGALFIWKIGGTPGKKFLKLKVVNTSYQPIGFGSALIRESIGKFLSSTILYLGYLWVLIDDKHQAWHDKIAKSYVVKTDATGTLIPIETEGKVTKGSKITFTMLGISMLVVVSWPIIAYAFMGALITVAPPILRALPFEPFRITGESMSPNYVQDQHYIANKLAYQGSVPLRGDVIVHAAPLEPNKIFIRRIIGLPGDGISLQNGKVFINNQPLNESAYLPASVYTYAGSFLQDGKQVIVPDYHYFVLGDNRIFSADSREWGYITKENIIGKIEYCYSKCELSNNR